MSISVPDELGAQVKSVAGAGQVSDWVAEAIRRRLLADSIVAELAHEAPPAGAGPQ